MTIFLTYYFGNLAVWTLFVMQKESPGNRYPMTPRVTRFLEEELKQLKTVDRPRITAAIAEAREHGDLKKMPSAMPWAAKFWKPVSCDIEAKVGGAGHRSTQTTARWSRGVWRHGPYWKSRKKAKTL